MVRIRWALLVAASIAAGGFAAMGSGETRRSVAGPTDFEGQPVHCNEMQGSEEPDGTAVPSRQQWRRARRGLPAGQALALNEYTSELEAVPVMKLRVGGGHVTMPEQTAYGCASDGRLRLLPLSEADPEQAERYRRRVEAELASSGALTGLGQASEIGRGSSCPTEPLRLERDSMGPASRVALRAEPARARPRVVSATRAPRDRGGRGGIARRWCGKQTWRRTVVVTIDRRARHPSASASLGVYFVSRFADGYRVWGQPH